MKWWNFAHQIEVILICYDMTRAAIESVIKMLALGWSYHWIHNAAWPTIILSTTMHCRTVTTFDCTAIYALHYISRRHIHCNNVCSVHYISYALHFMALHNMRYISLQYPLCTVASPHAHWWYHWIGNGLRCAANDLNQNSTISHKNAPSRQIIIQTESLGIYWKSAQKMEGCIHTKVFQCAQRCFDGFQLNYFN